MPSLSPAEGRKRGVELVQDLLTRRPEPMTNSGLLRTRDAAGREKELPAKFEVFVEPTGWTSTYEVLTDTNRFSRVRLEVVRAIGKTNVYRLTVGTGQTNSATQVLSGVEIMAPFAGSEFWVADLGLEFLHWPSQVVIRKQMRKGQACDVLESTTPNPVRGGYSRVVSWIDADSGGIVHADAYDSANELLKLFDPTALQKVNGQRQLKEMEMRNRKTGVRSWITFIPAE